MCQISGENRWLYPQDVLSIYNTVRPYHGIIFALFALGHVVELIARWRSAASDPSRLGPGPSRLRETSCPS